MPATFKAANTSFQIPAGGEVFIPTKPQGIAPQVYIRDGDTFKVLDLQSIAVEAAGGLVPCGRSNGFRCFADTGEQINNANQVWQRGIELFNEQTGQDYFSLPQQNIADVTSASRGKPITRINSIDEFKTSVEQAAPGGDIDISQGQTFDPVTKQLKDASGKVIGSTAGATGALQPTLQDNNLNLQKNFSLPQSNLKPGDTGTEVQQLQDFLVNRGFLTQAELDTGPGTFGPRTTEAVRKLQESLGVDNTTGVGFFGPRTRAGITSSNLTGQPSDQGLSPQDQQSVIDAGVAGGLSQAESQRIATENAQITSKTLPSVIEPPQSGVTETPNLPIPQTDIIQNEQSVAIGAQVQSDRTALDTRLKNDIETVQSKIDKSNQNINELTSLQAEGIDNVGEILQPFRNDLENSERDRLFINQNFQENQSLVDELDGLLTQGNELIKQQKEITGLAAIRNPRIDKTISDVNARAGVIQAVISARNGQINVASTLIDRSLSAMNADKQDQLAYYNTLINFYEGQKDDEGNKLVTLEKDKKDFLNAQISLLDRDLAQSEQNAQNIKDLMTDPDTALFMSKAGITLNDTPEQVNAKMARQAEFEKASDILSVSEAKTLGVPYGTTKKQAEGIVSPSSTTGNGTPLSPTDITSFESTYGWRPPFGVTFNEALNFMQDNPDLTPSQLEEAAVTSISGRVQSISDTQIETTTTNILEGMTDEQEEKLKAQAKDSGFTKLFGFRGDVKDFINSPTVQDLIKLGLEEGNDFQTILDVIVSGGQ